MKTDVTPSVIKMDKDELKKLVTEVKETVASVIDLNEMDNKTFSHVDMWNIRKGFRSANDLRSRN